MGIKNIPKVNTYSVLDQSCRSNFTTFSDTKHQFNKSQSVTKINIYLFQNTVRH